MTKIIIIKVNLIFVLFLKILINKKIFLTFSLIKKVIFFNFKKEIRKEKREKKQRKALD